MTDARLLNRRLVRALTLLGTAGSAACVGEMDARDRQVDYGPVTEALSAYVAGEVERWDIPALSIALVDGDETVWSAGFGEERPGVPATGATVYRVGSVSKLFTDLAVMQLVEQGTLDLDVPVSTYLPGVLPDQTGAEQITLRHLMAHRSGLVREPPVGHYFDDSGASLEATVASLAGTRLVYPPGARTKYSNAGVAVVGRVLEVMTGTPFASYLRGSLLEPMGLSSSAFEPLPEVTDRLAAAMMWTYHGVRFPAPTFELGMIPAGSMYTSVDELGRFLSVLFAGGESPLGGVIAPETLEAMWTPQVWNDGSADAPPDPVGYGLGFRLFEVDGRRAVGHGGAIYGFSTELQAVPDEGVGVVVTASLDGAGAVVGRIADTALRLMLAAREGTGDSESAVPGVPEVPAPLAPDLARRLDGLYGDGEDAVRLRERNGELYYHSADGGGRYRLGRAGDVLVTDDLHGAGTRIAFDEGGAWILVGETRLARGSDPLPPPPPPELAELVGEYGWDFNVLYVYEDAGRLRALIEWFYDYPLEPVGPDTFAFPDYGLYHGERLVFERDGGGRPVAVRAAGIRFPRREVGTAEGVTFRITPVRPVAELRTEALAAVPPTESGTFRDPELAEVVELDPSIRLDIRYASTNNFMGAVFYDEERAFLQLPAAEAVVQAHRTLEEYGLGILIHDGYRPWYVTRMFWDATPASQKVFVADPASGSRHNRGAAVDLTLYDRSTGQPVRTVGGYDEFSPRSYPEYPGGTARQRWYRELLRDVMEAEGFTVYEAEWWHFDYGDWREYPILNLRFDEIPAPAAVPGRF